MVIEYFALLPPHLVVSKCPGNPRWISADSVTAVTYDAPSLNKYGYARNDPVNMIDPDGKAPLAFTCGLEPGYVDRVRDRNVGATIKCVIGNLAPPSGPVPARLEREPKDPPQKPTLAGGDKNKNKDFQKALTKALDRLKEAGCTSLFGENGATKPLAATYKYDAVSTGGLVPTNYIPAATDPETQTVTINSQGHFFSQIEAHDDGSFTNWGYRTGLSGTNWQALILLHELGQLLGIFPADIGQATNDANTNRVLDKCFGGKQLKKIP